MGSGMRCGDASGGSASDGGTSTDPLATYAAKAAAKAAAAAIAAGKDRAEAARLAHEAAMNAYGLGSVEELNNPSFRGGGGGRMQRGEQASVLKGKGAAPYSGVGSGAMPGPSQGHGPSGAGARLEPAADPGSLTTKDLNDQIARFNYRKARSGLTPSDQQELNDLVVEKERRRTDVDLDDRIAALERKAIALEGQEIGPEEGQGGLTTSSTDESGPTVGGASGGGTTPQGSPTKANGLLRGISKGILFATRLSKGLSPAEQKEVGDLNAEKQLRKLRLAHGDERLPGPRKGPYAALGDKHLEDQISALELKAAPDGPVPKEIEELRVEQNRRRSDRELGDKITRLERRKDTDGLSPKEQTELEGMHAERNGRLSDRELDELITALERKKVRMALSLKEQNDLDELNVEKNRRRSHRNLDDLIAALEHKKARGGLTSEVQKEMEQLHAEKQARSLLRGDRDGASREATALSPSFPSFPPGSRPGSEEVGAAARDMLKARGFAASVADAAAGKARELMQQGLPPGAVIAGGLALGEALDAGQSQQSANVAAYAAAKAAEAEADKDPRVAAMMASGHSLPHILDYSLARGRAAAKRSTAGLDDHGFGGDNSSVVRFLRERDLPLEIARAGALKAIELFHQGFLPGAAFIGSVMYAEGLDDGLPPHSAEQGALAAARAAEAEAKRDRGVRTALRNNDVPPRVLELGLHAGHVVGQRSILGTDRFSVGGASDVGHKVTNELERLRGSKVGERDAKMMTAVITLPPDDVAKAAADMAYQMLDEGYSAGSAFAAGLALGTALDTGRRPPDAALAAVAAAKAAEDAGASSASVKAALEAGELPRALLERALTAGREAGMRDGREARHEGTQPRYGHARGADAVHRATSADDPGLDDPGLDDPPRKGLEGASVEHLKSHGYKVRLLDDRDDVQRHWQDDRDDVERHWQLEVGTDGATDDVHDSLDANLDVSRRDLDGGSIDVDTPRTQPVRAIDRARELVVKEHRIQERSRELKVEAQEIEVECILM